MKSHTDISIIDSLLLVSRYNTKEKHIQYEKIAEKFIWVALILIAVIILSPFGDSLKNTVSYTIWISVAFFTIFWFRIIPKKFSGSTKNFIYILIINIFIAFLVASSNGLQSFAVFFYYLEMIRVSTSTSIRFLVLSFFFVLCLLFFQAIIISGGGKTDISLAILHSWGILVVIFIARFFTGQSAISKEIENDQILSNEIEIGKVKDEFVYIISNKLKIPIENIKSQLQIISNESGYEKNSDSYELLNNTRANTVRLDGLLNDLMDVSKIEQGVLPIHLTDIAIKPVVSEVVSTLLLEANKKQISIINKISEDLAAKADFDRLKEVLINLIGNSIKYTPAGGKVIIDASKDDNFVTLRISDTGIGISENDGKHLFEKFYRIENDKTKAIKGSGLGLFITKQLVEKMDGKIRYESRMGEGTVFEFTLPRYRW